MTHRITPLARAIHLTLALGSLFTIPMAHAQDAVSASIIRFDVAAGPLDRALSQFGRQAGIALSIDASLTAGKSSPGVQGGFSVEQGFARLLAGTDLSPVRTDSGNYLLMQTAPGGDALELGATSINSALLGATTEGTGSYTTGSTRTATKMNLSIRETPQTITVVTRQRMDDQHLNSMTDVLKQTPGITMSQDGGERFNIYSRGSAINIYQFDGVTTYQDNQTRNMPSTFMDVGLYDRIEIVRGATGLMTGAGDPSGVVNVIRKRPTRDFQAHVQAGAGSWDYYRGEVDVSGPLNEQGSLRGRFVAVEQSNDTFMDWYSQDRSVLYGTLEADISDSTLVRLGIDRQTYKVNGAPGVPLLYTNGQPTHLSRSNSSDARWGHDDYETTNYTFNLEQQLANDWELKLATAYMKVDRDTFSSYVSSRTNTAFLEPDGSTEISVGTADAQQYQKGVDVTLQGPFELLGQTHELIAGFNYLEYQNKHRGDSGPDVLINYFTWNNETRKPGDDEIEPGIQYDVFNRQSGYYLASRLNFTDDLHLILGARVSNYRFDYSLGAADGSREPTAYSMTERGVVTPYAGVVYDLNAEQSVYASYTDIFKPQSNVDITGKPLDPEVGKNYEMGWKGEFAEGRVNANVALYLVQRDNFAESTNENVPGTDIIASRTVDGAETKGVDLELSGELLPGWNVYTGYSHSRTENADGDRLTTQLPMDTFRLWNTYRLPGAWDSLTVGGGVNWNAKSSVDFSRYNSRITQDDYYVVSLMTRYRITEQLAATLNLDNLFDEKYYAGMAGSYGHYGPPRNATLSVRYDF